MAKIFAFGDIHAPFHDKAAIRWALDLLKEMNSVSRRHPVTHVVQCGDLFDLFSFTKFARNPFSIRPDDELAEALEFAQEFWRIVRKYAPRAKLYQIKGNHDDRLIKRIIEKFPEIAGLVDLERLWKFDGVTTVHDSREPLVLARKVLVTHGWKSQLGSHARFFQHSVMCGHTHRGGVVEIETFSKPIIELNCGYLADPTHDALKYTPTKFTAWTKGVGWWDDLGARFIRYPGK